MRSFPPAWKFSKLNKRKRRKHILSIADIIKNSSSINNCLDKIKNITKRELNVIERRTRLQAKNEDWFHYRKGLITGTLTLRVSNAIKKGEKSDTINKSISKCVQFPLYYPAVVWGRDNEELGITAFIKAMKPKHYDLKVRRVGVRIDDTHHFIGASIDGLVECSCCEPKVLEIKCPYSIREGSVVLDGYKLQYLTDDLKLKRNHQYYYQLQTYLGVYKCKMAYFCVYTPADVLILDIDFDEDFWNNLKNELCIYYRDYYLNDYFN